ncbi:MAG: SGNH/GDSL hydrolase family protein [Clostridia bacterium]|nr:SGNH/GDSL hydrolase family protein [Clostridia bacterium]
MIKLIVCSGDSHTFGQGGSGIRESFDPPFVGGELRLSSFAGKSYVNELRRMVEAYTASTSMEIMAVQTGLPLEEGYALVDDTLEYELEADFVRIQLGCAPYETYAEILIDGNKVAEQDMYLEKRDLFQGAYNFYFHLSEGKHRITVKPAKGKVRFYRLEAYRGPYAVINCGVGSTATWRYMKFFFQRDVLDLKPYAVLMETHTINDWIWGEPPRVYAERLGQMFEQVREVGAIPLMLSVSPVAGSQLIDGNPVEYVHYIQASLDCAAEHKVYLCNAYEKMRRILDALPPAEQFDALFADVWHPNDAGHRIYAEEAFEGLKKAGLLIAKA